MSPTTALAAAVTANAVNAPSCAPSNSCVRFDQLATVYSENGTTTTTIDSAASSRLDLQPVPVQQIQITIETVDDDEDELEEDNIEEDYYDDEEEEDDDDEEEEEEDHFNEEEEMAVLGPCDAERGLCGPNRASNSSKPSSKLRSLFHHFHSSSHDTSSSSNHASNKQTKTNASSHTLSQHQITNGKEKQTLTRSSSLQSTSNNNTEKQGPSTVAATVAGVNTNNTETDSNSCWRPADSELLKFKRSSIAGFTVAASTGPLGLFKATPRHYEETHL